VEVDKCTSPHSHLRMSAISDVQPPIDIRVRQHNQLIPHILHADVRRIVIHVLIKRPFPITSSNMISDYTYIFID
jgi:hypothetical protein